MHKVAAIGDRESVSGFRAIGMDVFTPSDKNECQSLLKRLCDDNYGIIYITEEFSRYCADTIKKYENEISHNYCVYLYFIEKTCKCIKKMLK